MNDFFANLKFKGEDKGDEFQYNISTKCERKARTVPQVGEVILLDLCTVNSDIKLAKDLKTGTNINTEHIKDKNDYNIETDEWYSSEWSSYHGRGNNIYGHGKKLITLWHQIQTKNQDNLITLTSTPYNKDLLKLDHFIINS